MIATVFFSLIWGIFTVWVTWQWGIWVALLTWVGLGWGMLICFSAMVERGQAKVHQQNVERIENIKREKGEERVH